MDKVRIAWGRAGACFPFVLQEMGEAHKNGRRTMLLVPEQYTLQAERDLMDGLSLPGLLHMDVVSPSRLLRLIRERGGHGTAEPVDAFGRTMILSYLLTQHKDELQYYRTVADTPSLPRQLSDLLHEMQQVEIRPDELPDVDQEAQRNPAYAAKMADIRLIWQAYQEMVSARFADDAAQWADALRHASGSGVFQGVGLWVYGFDLLAPLLVQLLADQARHMDSLTFTFTLGAPNGEDGRVFRTGEKGVQSLIQAFQSHGVPVRRLPALPQIGQAGHTPALQYLEKHLFGITTAPFQGDAPAIRLHIAATPYQEAAWCTATLLKLHQRGIPWHRMAVAIGTPSLYGDVAVNLSMAGIPHYLGQKVPAARHGLCRFLCGALRAATKGYQQADVLYLLKSGFSPLNEQEAQQLELYALEQGINRRKWLTPFTRGAQAQEMEPLRQRLMAPLTALQEELRSARSATASASAIYALLQAVSAYQALLGREEQLLAKNMQAEASQNRQVWRLVMGLLNQLHALLGDRRATMSSIATYVTAGIDAAFISGLPPAPDAVMVGEVGHLMTGSLDGLVMMGMQDTLLQTSEDSLLTPQERKMLEAHAERDIGHDPAMLASLRMADVYRTVALPSQQIVFSCATGTENGAALRESSLLLRLRMLFPQMEIQGGVTGMPPEEAPISPLHALDELPLRMQAWQRGEDGQMPLPWQDALRYMMDDPAHQARVTAMVGALDGVIHNAPLPRDVAASLFPMDSASISRLETYAKCPYQHFVKYGLRPLILKPYTYAADERGTFFHDALSQYVNSAMLRPEWPRLSEEAVQETVTQVLQPLVADWDNGPLGDDALGALLGQTYQRIVHTACQMVTRQAANSNFVTWCTEVGFGYPDGLPPIHLQLGDGRTMTLRGRIDRIDLFEGQAGEYVRVVDYKSSSKNLDATRVWHGLQLQLLMYLAVAAHGFPKSIPAGAYYFTLQDELVDASNDLKETAETLLAKEMRLKGITLRDIEVVQAADRDEPGFSLGNMLKKDETFMSNSKALSAEALTAMMDTTRARSEQLAMAMVRGDIAISPAWKKGEQGTPCDYCDYAGICGRDPYLTGWAPRELAPVPMSVFDPALSDEESVE